MDADRIAHLELERRHWGPGRVANGNTVSVRPRPQLSFSHRFSPYFRLTLAAIGCLIAAAVLLRWVLG